MDILLSAVGVAATAFFVIAFCSGVKAACRKILKRDVDHKKQMGRT